MVGKVIKYGGLALVIVGIVLVMKSLFKNDDDFKESKYQTNKVSYYSASISLVDSESNAYIEGANLKLMDNVGNVLNEWTTDSGARLITNLENGTYILEQTSLSGGYSVLPEKMTFEVDGEDAEVILKNAKNAQATSTTTIQANGSKTGDEVGVESTASSKSIIMFILGAIIINYGILTIKKLKEAE